MEAQKSTVSGEKLDLLKHFHGQCRTEANFLRARQDKLFTWSSNILVAIAAGLFVVDQTKFVTLAQDPVAKSVSSIAIIFFAYFSGYWQNRNREWQEQNMDVVNKIDHLLYAYDAGYFDSLNNTSLFPNEWDRTGKAKATFSDRLRRVNNVTAIAILAIIDIAMIWAVS
jgi:hypothetical protein